MNPYYLAMITALLWGIVPILEKLGLREAPPLAGLAVRSSGVIIGLVLLSIFYSPWKDVFKLSPKTIILLSSGGLIASFLGQFIFYHALKSDNVSRVVPISACYPLIAFFLGVIFLGEKLTLAKSLGVFLVILGAILLR